MTVEKVLYTAKDIFTKQPLLRLVFATLLAARRLLREPLLGEIQRLQVFLRTAEHSDINQIMQCHLGFVSGAISLALLGGHRDRYPGLAARA
jgi:hypothetical protein